MAVAVVDVQVNSTGAVNQIRNVANASKAAQSSVNGLENAVRGLVGAFSAAQAVRFIFGKTAEIESQVKSLQVLTGSVQQAKQIIQELQQLGAVTPFTSTELIDAAKRLNAFGVAAKDVVDTTRRLADVSGATGAELQGLVTAYGQVQAKGRLQGEELLQFQERGVALQKELQRMYRMSGDQFREALSKGRISAEAVQVAIQNLTNAGGKYANGAIAQSDTLQGKFSTLQDAVEGLARTIGQVFAPLFKYLMDEATKVITVITDAINMAAMGPQKAKVLSEARAGRLPTSSLNPLDFFTGNTSQQKLFELLGKGNAKAGETIFKKLAEQSREGPGFLPNLEKLGKLVSQQPGIKAAPAPAQKPGTQPPALLAPTGGGGGKDKTKVAEAERKRQAQQIADAQSLLSLTQSQFNIEGQILLARSQNNDALVTTRTAQKELAAITNEIADVRANKELPDAAKLAKIADLELKAKGLSRQLAFDLAIAEKEKAENAANAMQKLKDEQALMQARLNGNEAEVLLNQQIRDLKAQYPGLNEADIKSTLEKTNALKEQVSAAEELKQLYADIGTTIKSGVVDAIQGAIDGTKSLQEVANNLLSSIANKLLDVAVNFALFGAMSGTGTGGGLLGGLFKRANGGSVMAGQGYLVGERGPELFMPGRSGGIAPSGSFSGGANVVVNVDASGTSAQGNGGQANQLGKVIGAAVQAELIKQRRPGGLLA